MQLSAKKACKKHKAIYFIDEADACKSALLNCIIDKAVRGSLNSVDMVNSFNNLVQTYKTGQREYLYADDLVSDCCKQFEECYQILKNEFQWGKEINFEPDPESDKDKFFLYHPNVKILPGKITLNKASQLNIGLSGLYCYERDDGTLVLSDNEEQYISLVQSNEKAKKNGHKPIVLFKLIDFVYAINRCCRKGLSLIRILTNLESNYKYANNIESDRSEIIDDILRHGYSSYSELKDDSKNSLISLVDNMAARKKKDASNITDFFMNGFNFIVVEQNGAKAVFLKTIFMIETPENTLVKLLNYDANVVLSSATGNLMGSYCNYILTYDKISNNIYHYDEYVKSQVLSYVKEQKRYALPYIENNLHFSSDTGIAPEERKERLLQELLTYSNYDSKVIRDRLELIQKRYTDFNYHYGEICTIVSEIIKSYFRGNKVHLSLSPFNIKEWKNYNSNDTASARNGIFYDLMTCVRDFLDVDIPILYVNTSNISESMSMVQNYYDMRQFVVIVTSYQSFMKGVNAFIESDDTSDYIKINNRESNYSVKRLDYDSLFLGRLTNIAPGIIEDDIFQFEKSQLSCLYYIESDFISSGRISAENRFSKIWNILGSKWYETQRLSLKDVDTISETIKLLNYLCQSTGRIGRTGFRHKTVNVTIDENNFNELSKINLSSIYYNDGFTFDEQVLLQSPEVFKMLHYLDTSDNNHIKYSNNKLVRYCIRANSTFMSAREARIAGDPASNIDIVDNVNSITIKKEELDAMPSNAQHMYMPNSFNNTGYRLIGSNDDGFGNVVPSEVVPLVGSNSIYSQKSILNALGFSYNGEEYVCKSDSLASVKDVLESSSLNVWDTESKDYILTPKGFDILRGKIGESILDYYLGIQGLELIPANNESYEKCDRYVKYKDTLIAFDAKFYDDDAATKRLLKDTNEGQQLSLDYSLRRKSLERIYGMNCIIVIINCRPQKKLARIKDCVAYDHIIRVSNIFNDNFQLNIKSSKQLWMNVDKYINERIILGKT